MPARASSFDPIRNFKFRIKINGQMVAGVTKCSALTVSVESKDFRSGEMDSFKRKLPGMVAYEGITLEQGVTVDNKVFEQWATAMSNYLGNRGADSQKTPEDFRKEVDIEVYNLNNEKVKAYRVFQAWVSKYTAIPGLDASAGDFLIQTLVLEHEGIQVLQ
jgi:phage tail-like protein